MFPIGLLKKGEILPPLNLPSACGGEANPSDYRGRRNLVPLLTHPAGCTSCEEMLRALPESLARLHSEDAEVLAIVPGPPQ